MSQIPPWAQDYLQSHLPPGNPVVNAVVLGRNKVLCNTRLGAVLVTRGLFTGTRHTFVEVPSEKVAFKCAKCEENLQFYNLPLPAIVFCSLCASKYQIDESGHVRGGHGLGIISEFHPAEGEAGCECCTPECCGDGSCCDHSACRARGDTGPCCSQSGCCKNGCDPDTCCPDETCQCCVRAEECSCEVCQNGRCACCGDGEACGCKDGECTCDDVTCACGPDGQGHHESGDAHGHAGHEGPGKSHAHAESAGEASAKEYQPQCAALTANGAQCRNSARGDSKYCASHKGYHPPGVTRAAELVETAPANDDAPDFHVSLQGALGDADAEVGGQCAAITANGAQCRRTSREGSKYCSSHKGYQPPTAKQVVEGRDTKPRHAGAADTKPSVRKGRKKSA